MVARVTLPHKSVVYCRQQGGALSIPISETYSDHQLSLGNQSCSLNYFF
jgi:hypothetical protein